VGDAMVGDLLLLAIVSTGADDWLVPMTKSEEAIEADVLLLVETAVGASLLLLLVLMAVGDWLVLTNSAEAIEVDFYLLVDIPVVDLVLLLFALTVASDWFVLTTSTRLQSELVIAESIYDWLAAMRKPRLMHEQVVLWQCDDGGRGSTWSPVQMQTIYFMVRNNNRYNVRIPNNFGDQA
jgi:hypothetical protein